MNFSAAQDAAHNINLWPDDELGCCLYHAVPCCAELCYFLAVTARVCYANLTVLFLCYAAQCCAALRCDKLAMLFRCCAVLGGDSLSH